MDMSRLTERLTGNSMPPGTHVAWLARSFGRRDLAPLLHDDVAALSEILRSVVAPAGTKILATGDPADAAYIVESGEVELLSRHGGRRSLVSIQRAGGVFGDVPMLCALAFPFDAVARRDSRLLVVGHDELLDILSRHPAIGLRWLSSAVKRLEHANRRLAALASGDVAARVTVLLADEVAGQPDHDRPIEIDLTQSEIAALLGVGRQAVNRAIQKLADDHVVRTAYGRVLVDDPAALLDRGGRAFPVAPSC